MLLVRPLPIAARENGGQLHDRLARLGAESIVAAVEQCLSGRLVAVRQPDESATYAAKIRKQEAVIDWRQSSVQIDRQVRAFNPWRSRRPAGRASSCASGKPRMSWPKTLANPVAFSRPRAAAARRHRRGALLLHRVQLAGRRAMTPAEFLNAHPLAGARLGE